MQQPQSTTARPHCVASGVSCHPRWHHCSARKGQHAQPKLAWKRDQETWQQLLRPLKPLVMLLLTLCFQTLSQEESLQIGPCERRKKRRPLLPETTHRCLYMLAAMTPQRLALHSELAQQPSLWRPVVNMPPSERFPERLDPRLMMYVQQADLSNCSAPLTGVWLEPRHHSPLSPQSVATTVQLPIGPSEVQSLMSQAQQQLLANKGYWKGG